MMIKDKEPDPKLVDGLTLIALAEWLAIDDGKTRLESLKYIEQAGELSDYLHVIGYRILGGTGKPVR